MSPIFLKSNALFVAILSWFLAQSIKIILVFIQEKKIDFTRLYGAGGMPSSHSALVSSLSTIIGLENGFDSNIFALSAVFALVVMYDATGVRRAAGKQAEAINILFKHNNLRREEQLKVLLGHTPLQVSMGFLLGIGVALTFGGV